MTTAAIVSNYRAPNRGYWLLKGVTNGRVTEAFGIISFSREDNITFIQLDILFDRNDNEWSWNNISKTEYETYREFGFKEYKVMTG